MATSVFYEKYRPKDLESIVLPSRIKRLFETSEVTQNYLFYSGPPGAGKTTLCKILCQPYDSLEINISDESSVDTIRNKVKDFISTGSIVNGAYPDKIVFFDEIDGASDQFFKALRGVIEQFEDNCKFIATCNYITKVPDNIISRFFPVRFEPENEEEEKEILKGYFKRLYAIIKKHDMEIEKDVLVSLIKRYFPDMRSMLNIIQSLHISKVKEIQMSDIVKASYDNIDIFEFCVSKKNSVEAFKLFSKAYAGKTEDVLVSLGDNFIEWLLESNKVKNVEDKIGLIIREVAIHQVNTKFVIDPIVNMLSCIYAIQEIINNN